MHAARAKIGGMQARARGPFVELHQPLAFFEPPENWGHGADIDGEGGDVEDMVENAANFAIEHADVLAAPRHLNPQKPFNR